MSRTIRSYYGFDKEKPWQQGKFIGLFRKKKMYGGQIRSKCRSWRARGLFENAKFEVSL